MDTWEYKLISSTDAEGGSWLKAADRGQIEQYLNDLGAEGWEIIGIDFADHGGSERAFFALARRPKSDPF